MKFFFIIILVSFIHHNVEAQKINKYIITNIVIGGNFVYIPSFYTAQGSSIEQKYNEYTSSANIAIDIKKHLRVGFDYKKINTLFKPNTKKNYSMSGVFVQYKFLDNTKRYFYAELAYYNGNYCTCGDYEPYTLNNTKYASLGGGVNLKLHNNFRLDLGFTSAQVLNKVYWPYNYTQYIIGLDYVFPFLKK
jgi:hypothetical protein